MGKHQYNSEAPTIGIRMAAKPLKVYPMHCAAKEEQESSCSTDESHIHPSISACSSSSSSSDDSSHQAAPITSCTSSSQDQLHDSEADDNDDGPLAMDIVRTMCRQEATIYHHPLSYFVEHSKQSQRQPTGTSSSRRKKNLETMDSWRSSLIQWMYQVADFSHVRKETVGVAVYFLDVAISKIIVPAMNRNQSNIMDSSSRYCLEDYKVSFQLAAATALQLSIKTQDCRLIKLKDLVILGRNAFTERDISHMEVQIIEACGWYLHPPSVYCFLHQYQSLLWDVLKDHSIRVMDLDHTKSSISKWVHRITEIILPQAQFKSFPPSILAYAIMLIVMALTKSLLPQQRQLLSRQISLAFIWSQEDKSEHVSDQEQQQYLLIQAIQQVRACCQQSSHLDNAQTLQDLVILESNKDGKPKCLVCLTLDDYTTRLTGQPKTPPSSTVYSSSSFQTINRNHHSPISVMDPSSLLLSPHDNDVLPYN